MATPANISKDIIVTTNAIRVIPIHLIINFSKFINLYFYILFLCYFFSFLTFHTFSFPPILFSNCFIFKRKKATYFRFLNSPKIHSFLSMFIYLFIKFYDIYIYIYTASRLSRFTICLSPLSFAVYILYQIFFICQQIFSFLFSYP